MDYAGLKLLHVALVLASGAGFVLRGWWMMRASPLLQARPTRVVPHVVDTLLLVTGVALAVWAQLNPAHQPWLLAKLVALVAYILLGTVALKRGRSRAVRAWSLAGAVAVFGYMVAVAVHHDPMPFL